MSDITIRAEGLSKQYRIGQRQRYKALRDTLTEAVSAPWRRLAALVWPSSSRDGSRAAAETIWALKNVSFEVRQGEAVGIIGRNGAGKSTLLKILSRITEPTEGSVELRGRVGSLLEVGTGFHPELTGRENIFLNGAILGMLHREIQRKFDEIVAFAEVEKFIDTPVKHYSSGMYMRLAFAVAAHLEPEILLVDEVLAVGDAAFQKKCLGKMNEVAQAGRTVLFVSHNLAAVQRLCRSLILLDRGTLVFRGAVQAGIAHYLEMMRSGQGVNASARQSKFGAGLRFVGGYVGEDPDEASNVVRYTAPGYVVIDYDVIEPLRGVQVVFELWSSDYGCVFCSTSLDSQPEPGILAPGRYRSVCHLPPRLIRPGAYWINLSASVPGVQMLDEFEEVWLFDVLDDGSPVALLSQGRRGIVLPVLQWQTTALSVQASP